MYCSNIAIHCICFATVIECSALDILLIIWNHSNKSIYICLRINLYLKNLSHIKILMALKYCMQSEEEASCTHSSYAYLFLHPQLTIWCSVCSGHWAVDLQRCQSMCGFHYNVVQSIWLQCWDVVRQLWWAGHNDLIVWCTTLSVQNPESCWLGIPLHIQPAWTRCNG